MYSSMLMSTLRSTVIIVNPKPVLVGSASRFN